mgnify:CR=1 FL=1
MPRVIDNKLIMKPADILLNQSSKGCLKDFSLYGFYERKGKFSQAK